MSKIDDAIKLAEKFHSKQQRRDGRPYFLHPQRVAELVRQNSGTEDQIIIGYLHDVIEDLGTGSEDAKREIEELYGKDMLAKLMVMTKREGENYGIYIERVKGSKELSFVKICDIVDNLTDNPTEEQKAKYTRALLKLTGCV